MPGLPDERLCAYITADLLQHGDHRSLRALEKDNRGWVNAWDESAPNRGRWG
jgi:hypothetical protein